MRKLSIAIFLSFLIGGCVGIKSSPMVVFHEQIIRESPPIKYDESIFAYSNTLPSPSIIEEKILETERYQSYFLSMPSSGPNGQNKNLATARYLKNKTIGQKKLIIILPIYGSSTYPPDVMALRFTEWNERNNNTNVLVIFGENDLYDLNLLANANTEQKLLKTIAESAERIANSVIDIRRFLDWATAQQEIDRERIGIIGFSLGASIASIAMGVDYRIARGSFLMGGANINEIFALSKADFLQETQEKIVRKFGWTRRLLSQKIKAPLENVNPANFAARSASDAYRVLIVEASLDQYIPKSARDDFWNAWQKPKRIFLSASHKMAFLAMTIANFNRLDRQIFEFFEKNL